MLARRSDLFALLLELGERESEQDTEEYVSPSDGRG
jgi:hypothetical protein